MLHCQITGSPYAGTLSGGLRPPYFTGKSQGQRFCESLQVRKVTYQLHGDSIA